MCYHWTINNTYTTSLNPGYVVVDKVPIAQGMGGKYITGAHIPGALSQIKLSHRRCENISALEIPESAADLNDSRDIERLSVYNGIVNATKSDSNERNSADQTLKQ